MKTVSFRRASLSLSLLMLAAGCATQQQTAVAECAVGGAGLGLVLCKVFGKSDRECAAFVAVGTGLGAGGCHVYATALAERRKQLAGRENDLDAQLQYVRGLNDDVQRLNADLRGRVDAATQRSRELAAQVGRGGASATAERRRLDDEVKAANQQVELQKTAFQEVKTYQSQRAAASPALDAEIARQDRLLADAQRQVAALASLKERV